jgi:peptidoglycan LD-endopeptidase LytH
MTRSSSRLLAAIAAVPLLAVVSGLALFVALFTVVGGVRVAPAAISCSGSSTATDDIPAEYLGLYRAAGQASALDWAVLAAIGEVESRHGANDGPSSAGALGPMQFLPGTWALYGTDGDGDGRRDIMDPADAIPAAAALLMANGAPGNWPRAIFAYNHAGWYVQRVLAQAERYRGRCTAAVDGSGEVGGAGNGAMAWPVRGPITSRYCEQRAWERCHPGIDIAVPAGTPVRAAEAGAVTLATPTPGYGNFICVTHSRRLTTCYAHLSEYLVARGDRVRRAEAIALSGCTGRCFGPHLHFEVRLGSRFGAPTTDPLRYLAGP